MSSPSDVRLHADLAKDTVVEPSASLGAANAGTGIWRPGGGGHAAAETIVLSVVGPEDAGVGEDVAAAEEVDVINGGLHTSGVAGVGDDVIEVREDMVAEHTHEIRAGASEGIGDVGAQVGGARKCHELAGLILGAGEGDLGGGDDGGGAVEGAGGEGVEEVVDGVDVVVPLVDAGGDDVDVAGAGDGVNDAGVLALVHAGGGTGCGGGGEAKDRGGGEGLHFDWLVVERVLDAVDKRNSQGNGEGGGWL